MTTGPVERMIELNGKVCIVNLFKTEKEMVQYCVRKHRDFVERPECEAVAGLIQKSTSQNYKMYYIGYRQYAGVMLK